MISRVAVSVAVLAAVGSCTARRSTPARDADAASVGHAAAPAPAVTSAVAPASAGVLDVVVRDCDGNDVRLGTLGGGHPMWIFAAHGWCGSCRRVSANQEDIVGSFDGRDLVAVNVLVENAASDPPTASDCRAWRDKHGFRKVITLYDPSSTTNVLWERGDNGTSLTVLLDAKGTVVARLHSSDPRTLRQTIEAALFRP